MFTKELFGRVSDHIKLQTWIIMDQVFYNGETKLYSETYLLVLYVHLSILVISAQIMGKI